MKKILILSVLTTLATPARAAQKEEQKKLAAASEQIQLKTNDRDRDNLPWGTNCFTKLPPNPNPNCQGNLGCGDSAGCNFEGPGNDNMFFGSKAGTAIKQGSGIIIMGDYAGSMQTSNVMALGNTTTQQVVMTGLSSGGTGAPANVVVAEVPPSNVVYAATGEKFFEMNEAALGNAVFNVMKRNPESVARVVLAGMEKEKELREMFHKIMATIDDSKPKQ